MGKLVRKAKHSVQNSSDKSFKTTLSGQISPVKIVWITVGLNDQILNIRQEMCQVDKGDKLCMHCLLACILDYNLDKINEQNNPDK